MFYMFFVSGIITYFLQETKKVGTITTVALGIMDGITSSRPCFAWAVAALPVSAPEALRHLAAGRLRIEGRRVIIG